MIAIVNTDLNWGIGKENALQVHISEDLKRFKKMTTGKVIIYGKKTLLTYPKQKPLPNRKNIILSRDPNMQIENTLICHSLEELSVCINELKTTEDYQDEDFIVVGGASIYQQLLSSCTDCHVTCMETILPADCHFPNLDQMPEWEIVWQSERQFDQKNNLHYYYRHYQRLF